MKTPQKCNISSFWLYIDFICTSVFVHSLVSKFRLIKVVQGHYLQFYFWRAKLIFSIYSTSVIAEWKLLHVKAKVKAILQNHDSLAASFENKLNFMNWRSNYLEIFKKKLSLVRCLIHHTPYFLLGMCQDVHVQLHVSNSQVCYQLFYKML